MRRMLLLVFALSLTACATVYDDRYGYYRDDAYGDYYYEDTPEYGGYYAYDALFWGLRYSYFDPFWYPHFHYGITYFPRHYYGWPYWRADAYWAWRWHHPYSPYYGSYWDHYYAWNHRHTPRRSAREMGVGDPQRYGSARNAAERMARERGLGLGSVEWGSAAGQSRAVDHSLADPNLDHRRRASLRSPDAAGYRELPSSRYATGMRAEGSERWAIRDDGLRGDPAGGFRRPLPADRDQVGFEAGPQRSLRMDPDGQRLRPGLESRRSESLRMDSAPRFESPRPMRSERAAPEFRSDAGRGLSEGRAERSEKER